MISGQARAANNCHIRFALACRPGQPLHHHRESPQRLEPHAWLVPSIISSRHNHINLQYALGYCAQNNIRTLPSGVYSVQLPRM